jgi:hypothetical protein
VTLDGWRASSGSRFPDLVKVDVEGAEDSVLRGAADTFSRTRPVIYLALHGQSQREACARLLGAWDYRVVSLEPGRGLDESDEWVAEPR